MGSGAGPRKQFLTLNGVPVWMRSLAAFEQVDGVAEIAVVVPEGEGDRIEEEWAARFGERSGNKPVRFVAGGPTRQESVARGLAALSDTCRWVVVHDGVRPLVTPSLIERVLAAARVSGAATAGIPVSDTVKRVDEDGRVVETLPRAALRAIQTPQAFSRELLERAHARARDEGAGAATDDAALVERLGAAVTVVEGDPGNIKLTYPADRDVAAALLRRREGPAPGLVPVRVGHGFDVHRLEEGRPLILGGVVIPWEKGLAGHSDADVLTHAVIDSVLGAAGLGDIGRHFPDTDPAYRGADSMELLRHVVAMVADRGWAVGQVDGTVVAQRPKLAPYIEAMRASLAAALQVEPGAVNVKATTSEGLGFAGRGEGMAAYAVSVLVRADG